MRLRNRPSAKLVGYAAFWLLSAGLAYVAFDAMVSPKVASTLAGDVSGAVTIDRSYDQHFYVAGAINGHPVTFMVDTGASVVSVSAGLARKIGLPAGAPAVFETFGGRISGRMVPDVTVEAGGIRVDGIRVGVGSAGPQALLGQNFLNKVDLTQTAERMTLRVRSAN